jgi:hypothetical protein
MTCRTRIVRPADNANVLDMSLHRDLLKVALKNYNKAFEDLTDDEKTAVRREVEVNNLTLDHVDFFKDTPFGR